MLILHKSKIKAKQPKSLAQQRQRMIGKIAESASAEEAMSRLSAYFSLAPPPTTEPILPLLFRLHGRPYTLAKHYVFEPLFATMMPDWSILLTGRQSGKTQQLAGSSCLRSITLPGFRQMYVTPYFNQIRRFSHDYVKPLIEYSPYRSMFLRPGLQQNVLQRTLTNGSSMLFGYASRDVGSLRGASVDAIGADEIQDFDPDVLSVLCEASSASPWDVLWLSGTSKKIDGPDQLWWRKSSQAEWHIPCRHCSTNGLTTWNIPSVHHHALDMIGPPRIDISPEAPGIVCHKCKKPVLPNDGMFVHAYPERVNSEPDANGRRPPCTPGWHVPQIIMPSRCEDERKWSTIVRKFEGRQSYGFGAFCNEVLGEAWDSSSHLINSLQLQRTATLDIENKPTELSAAIIDLAMMYPFRAIGIDWGGGGVLEESWTAVALLGYLPGRHIDLLWGRKLYTPNDYAREASSIMRIINAFKPHLIAHDFNGKGDMREQRLIDEGMDEKRLMGMGYVQAGSRAICKFVPPTPLQPRSHYTVDKARSLQMTTEALKSCYLRTFKYDYLNEDQAGLLHDFTHLVEAETVGRGGRAIYKIIREVGHSDDFAQAVNYGCTAIWHAHNSWPRFSEETDRYQSDFEDDWSDADLV